MARTYRVLALASWAFLAWIVLAWTATAEQLLFGAGLSLAIGLALSPLGRVVGPWQLLWPPTTVAFLRLVLDAARRIVGANVSLARRVWLPSRPLDSGMVVVACTMRTDAGIAWTGLITSLIVDNQVVDLDRSAMQLQYHAVSVPSGGEFAKAAEINLPVEQHLARLIGAER